MISYYILSIIRKIYDKKGLIIFDIALIDKDKVY